MITRFLSRLALCVILLSSFASYAQSIRFTTWNIEWLTLNPDAPDDKGKRSDADFQALTRHFQRFNTDILAFQEVDSIAAIQKVVGNDYRIVLSERAMPQHQQHQFRTLALLSNRRSLLQHQLILISMDGLIINCASPRM
ncbi:hypothetical protein [Vibrio metschnikovii]|uniref:hypothetical protein n=1 Tax=Vibrio metschnikovii TaxID=28172 RepID=UPI0020C701D2|nr:hypothetical protein [Vibrio metschnikovii]